MNITIRNEHPNDHREVETLVRDSFWNVYRPGCLEHYVLHALRSDPAFVHELNFVMEKDGRIIGQNVFMRAAIAADDGRQIPVLCMGPICIAPDLQKQGYGKMLLDFCLEKAKTLGYGAVCLEGTFDFYGKCGFVRAEDIGLRYRDVPEGESAPFFLCCVLQEGYLDGVTGVYGPPAGYFVSEEDCEVFDRSFPPREKLRLPGQLF